MPKTLGITLIAALTLVIFSPAQSQTVASKQYVVVLSEQGYNAIQASQFAVDTAYEITSEQVAQFVRTHGTPRSALEMFFGDVSEYFERHVDNRIGAKTGTFSEDVVDLIRDNPEPPTAAEWEALRRQLYTY